MGILDKLFQGGPRGIRHLEVFFEPEGIVAAIRAGGSSVSFASGTDAVVKKGVAQADATFHLDGALVRFAEEHEPEVTTVDKMDDDAWREFLNSRGHGSDWERWFASTRDGRWNVVYWK
jgi:hypothetical protein